MVGQAIEQRGCHLGVREDARPLAEVWLFRRDGEIYRWAASYGHSKKEHERIKQYMRTLPLAPGRGSLVGRTGLEGRAVQIADVLADPEYAFPEVQKLDRDAFVQVRAMKVRELVLTPMLGPDYIKFEKMGVPLPQYLQYQPAIFQQIAAQMQMFNLGADMIVAGIDDHGARVAYLGNPGTVGWLDKLGYAAIGSGGIHATTKLSLGSQTRESPLLETLYRVYEAKRAAEVAPGVGPDTDLAIVEKNRITMCEPDILTKMEEIRGNAGITVMPDLAGLAQLLASDQGEQRSNVNA